MATPFLPAEGLEAESRAGVGLSSHTAFQDGCSRSRSVPAGPPLGDGPLEETQMALGDCNTSCFPWGPRFGLGVWAGTGTGPGAQPMEAGLVWAPGWRRGQSTGHRVFLGSPGLTQSCGPSQIWSGEG